MRRFALLCVAFFVVISGCATTSTQPTHSTAQLQDLGEKCLAAGETANALKYLTDAAEKKPNDPVIEYDLALAYDQRGLQDKAISHLQNALKIKPAYPEALNTMGYIYATRGQFELARGAFQKALDDPFYKTPQFAAYNLGRLYEKNGDIQKALLYYQQAVKFDQHYGIAWLRTGQILEQLSRSDEARHAYGNAVRASPDLAEAILRFGILSYLAGDMEAALHSLSRVREIAPNTDMADEARKYLEKLNAATQKRTRSHASSHIPPGEIEVISNEYHQRSQINEELPSSAEKIPDHAAQPAPSPAQDDMVNSEPAPVHREVPGETQAPVVKKTPVPNDGGARAQGGISKSPESQPFRYIVQVGSFVDREKAEEIKTRLDKKGYSAVVKTIKHRARGKVFVIQLQPVNSASRASTLMTQLSGEIEGKPVIIKVPSR
ncbi:MAG: tetratricopeptide repeat protein [Syntrophobacteraceae bacterium]|jgi:Flp pilus assembly protein TadD